MYSLGQTSINKLATVEEPLRRVVMKAIQLSEQDFTVLEGVRSKRRQYELYAKGRTIAECRKAGLPADVLARPGEKKVTWTLASKHFAPYEGALGRAVDLGVFPYDPNASITGYLKIKDAMLAAAKAEGVKIRWGGDWDGDGQTEHGENDFGHFELIVK